jgi:hypothetical protein
LSLRFQVELVAHEIEIKSLPSDELLMRALLDHASGVEDDDVIRIPHGAEAVRDDDGGAPRQEMAQMIHDRLLVLRIERTGGLIEENEFRIAIDRARR